MHDVALALAECWRQITSRGLVLLRFTVPFLALAGLSLYLTLDIYLRRLESFVAAPNSQSSSRAMAAAGLCIIFWCLFQSAAAMAVVRVLAGKRPSYLTPIRRAELRLFAAVLRFLLLVCLWAALNILLVRALGMTPATVLTGTFAFLLGASYLASRTLFLAPAAVASEPGSALRRGWRLSSGHVLATLVLWCLIFLLPVLLLQTVGETLLGAMHVIDPLVRLRTGALTVSDVQAMRGMLPGLALNLTVGSGAGLILASVASVIWYQRLVQAREPAAEHLTLSPGTHAG